MNSTYKIVHSIPGRIRLIIPSLSSTNEHSTIEKLFLSVTGINRVRIEPIIQSMVIEYDPLRTDLSHLLEFVVLFSPRVQETQVPLFSPKGDLQKDLLRSVVTGILLLIAFLRKTVKHRPDAFDYLVVISTSYTVLSHGENKLRHPDVITGLISMLSLGSQNILQVAMVTWAVNMIEVFNDLRRTSQQRI
ncbi:MAG: HMA2 domain-containing protein [Bacillus sp. (in: firmicutes)]